MRFFIAILVGWLIYIPLFLIFNTLFFFISGLFAQLNGLPKNEIVKAISQNHWIGIKIGLGALLGIFISTIICSFIAGFIAHKKGITVGLVVALNLPIIGLLGNLAKGTLDYKFSGLIFISTIVFIGAFAGFLGEKFYTKFMLKTK